MNLFIVIIPILFQILIVILAGLAWFSFIKNIIGGSNKKRSTPQQKKMKHPHSMNKRDIQVSQHRRTEGARTVQNPGQNRRMSTQRPLLKDTSLSSLNAKNIVENLFKQTPQELYHLMVNNLPEKYHQEIKNIFNSKSWKRNLWNFVRRKDVWPFLQGALKSEGTTRTDLFDESKTYPRNKPLVREKTMDMQNDDQESILETDFEKEYDTFTRMYDDISNSLTFESLTPVVEEKLVVLRKQSKKNKDHSDMKKWLKNAILSKEILDRQNY